MNNILKGKLTSRGNLNGNVNTIVFAHNYNDLTNKPKINNVTLQGNKTASELGLATPSDITVTSVNEQTGDVVLSGSDIDYSVGMSVNAKIDDLESQIQGSGVQSVNGMTGNVTLTSNDINYSTGVTIKNKIDSVEGEIPSIYVSSVNGNSGAVTLTGSDIDYSEGVSLNDKIDAVEGEIPVVDYPVTSVNSKTGAVSITAQDIPMSGTDQTPTATAIGDLSQLSTSVQSSLVGAVNEVNNRLGNRLVGAWTADTSTGNLQLLTDYIDVEAGTYLVILTYPDTSANFVASLYNQATSGVYDNCYMSGGSWATRVIVTAFSGNNKICIASAQGATCNFSNKNRGSIRAIKLSNQY